jgi:hypothetical protein
MASDFRFLRGLRGRFMLICDLRCTIEKNAIKLAYGYEGTSGRLRYDFHGVSINRISKIVN